MLDERSKRILQAVVQCYINEPGPVGSRAIKKKFSFDVSPATIRNIMSDLEEMGFLMQPHTSAGRVPTDTGYRFYVNALSSERAPSEDSLPDELARTFAAFRRDINTFLDNASRMLSQYTHYIGITMTPSEHATTLYRIDLLPYRKNKLAAVLVTDEGVIQHRIVTLEQELSPRDLADIADYINANFAGMPLDEIRGNIVREMMREKSLCARLIDDAVRLCNDIFVASTGNVYISGLAEALSLPDFADLERIRELLKTLEDRHNIVNLLDRIADSEGTQVFIGSENPLEELRPFSLVASTYKEGNRPIGAVGIIGPTRMNYRNAISIVDRTARYITDVLTSLR
ncbi:MAG: heat-inducible transcriptional repressor HrcA [Thermodesulfovibrionales bacterium]